MQLKNRLKRGAYVNPDYVKELADETTKLQGDYVQQQEQLNMLETTVEKLRKANGLEVTGEDAVITVLAHGVSVTGEDAVLI